MTSVSRQRYWVYPSPVHGVKQSLIVPQHTRIGDLDPGISQQFRHAELWKTIELDPNIRFAGLDSVHALKDIKQQGYHIANAAIETIENWAGDPGDGEQKLNC